MQTNVTNTQNMMRITLKAFLHLIKFCTQALKAYGCCTVLHNVCFTQGLGPKTGFTCDAKTCCCR